MAIKQQQQEEGKCFFFSSILFCNQWGQCIKAVSINSWNCICIMTQEKKGLLNPSIEKAGTIWLTFKTIATLKRSLNKLPTPQQTHTGIQCWKTTHIEVLSHICTILMTNSFSLLQIGCLLSFIVDSEWFQFEPQSAFWATVNLQTCVQWALVSCI